MMKCRRRQAADPQKLNKNCQRSFFRFVFVEAEAIDVGSPPKSVYSFEHIYLGRNDIC